MKLPSAVWHSLCLRFFLVSLLGWLGAVASVPAWAGPPLVVDRLLQGYSLVPHVEYIEDGEHLLDFESASNAFEKGKGRHVKGEAINFGFSSSRFWFHFELSNPSEKKRNLLIQVDHAILDRIDFYCGADGQKPTFYRLGDHIQFKSRPVAVRNFVVPVELSSQARLTCIVQVESTSNVAVPLTVSDVLPFIEQTRAGDWVLGWFYGLAFSLFVYNLLVFLASRERLYLYYTIHILAGLGYNSALDGSFAIIWTFLEIQDGIVVFFVCTSIISALLFALEFLQVPRQHGIRRISYVVIAIISAVLLLLAIAPVGMAVRVSVYVGLISISYIWFLGVFSLKRDVPGVGAFILGFSAVMLIAVGALIASLGAEIDIFMLTYGMKFGWVIELTALSLGLAHRIGDLKQMHLKHELDMASARAESRAKTEFLAKVSHEIRTPMNGILGLTEMLATTRLTPEQERYVSSITSAGRVMVDVVNDLLDYSKLEAGKMRLNERFFDVRELIQDCAALFEMPARKKKLVLRILIRQGTPLRIKGDAGRLRQVLFNLLSNALKYTEYGHVFIMLSLTDEIRDERVVIRLSVDDTGIGIGREDQTRLFQSFSQIASDVSEKEPGSGLGLVICRQLIDLMGGQMGVDSLVGHGSSFWFTLPVSLEDDSQYAVDTIVIDIHRPDILSGEGTSAREAEAVSTPAVHLADSLSSTGRSSSDLMVRVLLAEDNQINLRVILGFLERLGIYPDVVENGRAAVEKFMQASTPYDLVFLDCQMPIMDGYEATRRIRAWEQQTGEARTPIIALSAHHGDFHVQQSQRAGMDLHLAKPLSFKGVSEAVTSVLGLGQ